jgi:hypothetical protein
MLDDAIPSRAQSHVKSSIDIVGSTVNSPVSCLLFLALSACLAPMCFAQVPHALPGMPALEGALRSASGPAACALSFFSTSGSISRATIGCILTARSPESCCRKLASTAVAALIL